MGVSNKNSFQLGHTVSLEMRKKIGDKLRGKKRPPEVGRKISTTKLTRGSKHSFETRAKIAEARARQKFPFNFTRIELAVHTWLASHGIEFIPQYRVKTHAFDIAIPQLKTFIEVDGCYWHGCAVHYPESTRGPLTDVSKQARYAAEIGWNLVRIWEHDIPLLENIDGRRNGRA